MTERGSRVWASPPCPPAASTRPQTLRSVETRPRWSKLHSRSPRGVTAAESGTNRSISMREQPRYRRGTEAAPSRSCCGLRACSLKVHRTGPETTRRSGLRERRAVLKPVPRTRSSPGTGWGTGTARLDDGAVTRLLGATGQFPLDRRWQLLHDGLQIGEKLADLRGLLWRHCPSFRSLDLQRRCRRSAAVRGGTTDRGSYRPGRGSSLLSPLLAVSASHTPPGCSVRRRASSP